MGYLVGVCPLCSALIHVYYTLAPKLILFEDLDERAYSGRAVDETLVNRECKFILSFIF